VTLPILWGTYMALRHGHDGFDGLMVGMRSITNVLIFVTVIKLLQRSRSPRSLITGLVMGCFVSMGVAAIGIQVFDVRPVMGSGRWQGMMPGANRFANLCGLVLLLGIGIGLSSRTRYAKAFGCFTAVASF